MSCKSIEVASKQIQLGYKAFDIHELAVHFVAEHAGLYREFGVDVSLVDTRAMQDDELPKSAFSVACGGALMRWLRGEDLKVVFVATVKPMFLICARAGASCVEDLRGQRIAGYPIAAPPGHFLRIVLEDSGLDPDNDVEIEFLPDDAARLERLQSGAAAGAVVSSAVMPFQLEELDLINLVCFGERLCVPTTGLAVNAEMFRNAPQTVAALRDAHRTAIHLIHTDRAMLYDALSDSLISERRDLDSACDLVREFFTPDGLVETPEIVPGVERLARSMNVRVPDQPWSLYDCTARVN